MSLRLKRPQTMQQSDVNSHLGKLLESHGIDISAEENWFVPNRSLPAIRCIWNESPENKSGRLDVQVLVEEGLVLEECFAGIGSDQDAFLDALHNFSVNSFHVMLAAFWGRQDSEHIDSEQWVIGGNSYTAYIGRFGTRATNGVHPGVPEETFAEIEAAIKMTDLKEKTHWVRTFFCNIGEKQVYEALVDNGHWLEGENALKKIEWPKSDKYFSVRNFMVLQRNS